MHERDWTGQCARCLRVPLHPYRLIMPDGEQYVFCGWECLAEYAAIAHEADQRLEEQVSQFTKDKMHEFEARRKKHASRDTNR